MTILAHKLIEIVPRIRKYLVVRLRQNGVHHSISQLQILELTGERPRTVSELAALQGVSKATMSATLSRMTRQGLVSRQKPLDDQRVVFIEPTAAGRAVSEEAREKAEAILDEMIASLSREEKDTLLRGLILLTNAVEDLSPTHPSEKE